MSIGARIFPLQLTSFEEYMFTDNHRAYPMVFTIRLQFDGPIDEARLRGAASVAAQRHPLLRSLVERDRRGRLAWHPTDQTLDFGVCDLEDGRAFPEAEVPDITECPGLRIRLVRPAQDKETITCQFHHVCTDGTGAYQFLADLLIAYHYGEDSCSHLPKLDPDALPFRNRRILTWRERLRILASIGFGIEGARKFFVRHPRPLIQHPWPQLEFAPPTDFPSVVDHVLDANDYEQLRESARALGVTTYELMLRELYLAIRDFRQMNGQSSGGSIRMNVPVNLRRTEHANTSAANIVSMVFLDRKLAELNDESRLLKSVHSELSRIKRFDVKYTFIYFSKLLKAIPGAYRFMSRSQKCHATVVFTNLGNVLGDLPLPYNDGRLVVGDAILVATDLTAPFRPLCSAALSLTRYAGDVRFNLHYDPRALDRGQAKELLNGFSARLVATIAGQGNHPKQENENARSRHRVTGR